FVSSPYGDLSKLARRKHDMLRWLSNPIEVVANDRPVDQLDRGEERALTLVMSVSRNMDQMRIVDGVEKCLARGLYPGERLAARPAQRHAGYLLLGTREVGTGNGHYRSGFAVEPRVGAQPCGGGWSYRHRPTSQGRKTAPGQRGQPAGRHKHDWRIGQVQGCEQQLIERSQIPGERVARRGAQGLRNMT